MRLSSISALIGALVLVGCGAGEPSAGDSAPSNGDSAGEDLGDVAGLLAQTWMWHATREPEVVSALLDAPGGEGWIALAEGDVATAKTTFEGADSASARLGLARTHLARAAALRSAGRLHRDAALELVRYRRDHADEIREGAYERVLAGLTASRCGADGDELAGFLAAAGSPAPARATPEVDAALRAVLAQEEPASADLGAYGSRLAFVSAMDDGSLEAAVGLLAAVHQPGPDVVDPLGRDEELGLAFEGKYYDCAVLPAIARYHLAEAWIAGSGLTGVGPVIGAAVEGAWGGELPAAVRGAARPAAADELPPWTALFGSEAVDRADWDAHWSGDGETFASRFGGGTDFTAAAVDQRLRRAAAAEDAFAAALRAGASPDGASLVDDLQLATRLTDRVLRTWMVEAVDGGHAVQAKRLGDRSVDPDPGTATRVSGRNDRAFLVEYARGLWRAGQPGAALDFVHPLAQEDPALHSVKHYLGQLDAASSIGLQGKTSQL